MLHRLPTDEINVQAQHFNSLRMELTVTALIKAIISGEPNENIVQNHLNIALLNVL